MTVQSILNVWLFPARHAALGPSFSPVSSTHAISIARLPVWRPIRPHLPGDPSTFELVRWYMRFGCVIDAAGDDVAMTRHPYDPDEGLDGILQRYEEARGSDLTVEEFEGILSAAQFRG
jgi:hypothetical protein